MKNALLVASISLLSIPLLSHAQSVDLLWQGETYTPPFYEGRSFWSKESQVTFLAIPQGLGNAETLNYRWSKNGTVLGSLSGIGQRILKIYDTVLSKSVTIKVEIVSGDNSILASSSSTLAPISPQTMIYEKHPLYGFLFHLAPYDGYMMGSEATFSAFPFFFNTLSRGDSVLSYTWKNNSQESSREQNVTFRAPEGESGTALIKASIKHANNIFGTADKSFIVKFENDAGF